MFKEIKASETLFINELSNKLEAEGKKIYRFGFGQSPFNPPHTIIDKLKEHAAINAYLPVQGLLELREAVAYYHQKINNRKLSADDIFIGPGSKILIYSILLAFKQADILLPAPTWVSYKPQADLCLHQVHFIASSFEERWRLSADKLAKLLETIQSSKPKILILTYPGNPDGMSHSQEELQAIAQVCRKHRVLIISDEIYGQLSHKSKHYSIISEYPEGTIITGGLSKMCAAGGWRLGTAILPASSVSIYPKLKEVLLGIASELYSSTSSPIQFAATAAYKLLADDPNYLIKQRKILSALGNYCAEKLSAEGVRVHKPEGGFYLFPCFSNFKSKLQKRDIGTSETLCDQLLREAGVVLLPGSAFGLEPSSLITRLSYVNFDGSTALENCPGNEIDEAWLKKFCVNSLEGIQALIDWLKL